MGGEEPVTEEARHPHPRRRWLVAAGGLLLVLLALAGIKAAQIFAMIKAGKAAVPPPESVASAQVEAQNWPLVRRAVGTLVAVRGVTLGTELPGTVREISFENGTSIEKDDLLVRLDTRTEEAQLASAMADLSLASTQLKRAQFLKANAGATQAELEIARARAAQAKAAVENVRVSISKKT